MCCGSQRAAARTAALAAAPRRAASANAPRATPAVPARPAAAAAVFEYVGQGVAEFRGPASGRSYRFAETGHRIAVDLRDRAALAAMPALRRVR